MAVMVMGMGSLLPAQGFYQGGSFALGVRNTANLFTEDGSAGIGAGGQFKIGFGPKVNTEWFYDYISSKPADFGFRQDHHIGWSVQFAPFKQGYGDKAFVPYFLGGQCFDLTRLRTQRSNGPLYDSGQIFSAAVQVGVGVSKFIGPRLELTLQGQYMVHLGKDAHFHQDEITGLNEVEVHNETSLAGHLLFTFSANYYLFNLWK